MNAKPTLSNDIIQEILAIREKASEKAQDTIPDGYWSTAQYMDTVNAAREKLGKAPIKIARARDDLKAQFEAGKVDMVQHGRSKFYRAKKEN